MYSNNYLNNNYLNDNEGENENQFYPTIYTDDNSNSDNFSFSASSPEEIIIAKFPNSSNNTTPLFINPSSPLISNYIDDNYSPENSFQFSPRTFNNLTMVDFEPLYPSPPVKYFIRPQTSEEETDGSPNIDEYRAIDSPNQYINSPILQKVSPQSSTSEHSDHRVKKKATHNLIERRYRSNINNSIRELKDVVPALCYVKNVSKKHDNDDDADNDGDGETIVEGVHVARRLSKATILKKSAEYIVYLKDKNFKLKEENVKLIRMLESLPGGNELYHEYFQDEQQQQQQQRRESLSVSSPFTQSMCNCDDDYGLNSLSLNNMNNNNDNNGGLLFTST